VFRDRRALGGHQRLTGHADNAETNSGEIANIAQTSTSKEVKSMEANEIREVIKAERAEEKRAEEFEALKNALVEKDKSLSELAEALKAEREKEPEMEDAFEHYKTCKNPDCRVTKGFNALIANAQKPESLTPEQVKAAMEVHKIYEAPDRIVIAGGG